jgi:hypothetical protein
MSVENRRIGSEFLKDSKQSGVATDKTNFNRLRIASTPVNLAPKDEPIF